MPKKGKSQGQVKKLPEKLLAKVPAEYVFWCHDGSVFADINELAEALKIMSDETFAYHANPEKNDFSNWVRDIIKDEQLADALARATGRLPAFECVVARINSIKR